MSSGHTHDHVTILKKCKGFQPYYFIKSSSLDIIFLTLMFISLCIDFVFSKQDVYGEGGRLHSDVSNTSF